AGQSQELNTSDTYKLKITRASIPVLIDGALTDSVWQTAEKATDFWQIILSDQGKAKRKTEVKMAYDDQFLYISTYAEDSVYYISNSLKRDAGAGSSDAVWIGLDPLNQRTNGYLFFLTPFDVQGDEAYSASGLDDLSFSWDTKWFSATKCFADHWTAEFAIPFKSFRYSREKTEWGINFYRVDAKNGQYSGWTKVPINISWNDFGYYGTLLWDGPPPSTGKNISVLPYLTGSLNENRETDTGLKGDFGVGFDAKVGVSPSLNLDITVNPDFSQVEVDQQVTNLTRFNIFFSERRPFFLENADLYSDIGYVGIRPFYSRTIGLDPLGNPIPIIAGARLSGNLNKNWRVGVMNMQTGSKGDFAAQNYTAATLKRQLLKRSSISGYIFNRQGFMSDEEKTLHPLDKFGRNTGVEARYTSKTTKWNAFAGYHLSLKPAIRSQNSFVNIGASYSSNKLDVVAHYNNVGTNYYTDMGFVGLIQNYDAELDTVIRLGFKQFYGYTQYRIIPKKSTSVYSHLLGIENTTILNPNGNLNDHLNRFRYSISFKNRSDLVFRLDRQDTRLLFFTSFTDEEPLPPGRYVYHQWNVEYVSDVRKPFTYTANYRQGSFYNGNLYSLNTGLNYRLQYWGNVSIGFNYSKLAFPEPYSTAEFLLVNPRIDLYFSNKLFWTTFLQYNTQINNFNVNSRLQWRYKPMSDLFLVYTDNYFSNPFLRSKNRALVLKVNYWLNM
ncbi:MAG: carbohydrate binding family 9 domain-containing protein, partial [Bacteroidetes bacterium]|nr:carbohydrate binding family 9 domain-containing protein [Bacteroidota bacterium]